MIVGLVGVGLLKGLGGFVRSGGMISGAGNSSIVVQVTRAGCDGVDGLLDCVIHGRVENMDVDDVHGFGGFSVTSFSSMLLLNLTFCSILALAIGVLK